MLQDFLKNMGPQNVKCTSNSLPSNIRFTAGTNALSLWLMNNSWLLCDTTSWPMGLGSLMPFDHMISLEL